MALYSADQVKIDVNGQEVQDGCAKGTFVEATYNEDRTVLDGKATGGGNVGLNLDNSGTFKLTMKAGTPECAYLDSVIALSKSGIGIAISVVGPHGGRGSLEAYPKKEADLPYSDTPDDTREYEFHTLEMYDITDAITALAGEVFDIAANFLV